MIEGEKTFEERLIVLKRVAKTVTGGKRLRLKAVSVVGDKVSRVGVGAGKALEVRDAMRKSIEEAKKNLIEVKHTNNTIPHTVWGKCSASKVMIKPASPGTGIIACEPVRAVLELGGVKDALTKSFGSRNPENTAKAAISALLKLRTKEEIEKMRGVPIY